MTAPVKMKSKGTAFLVSIASVYTAIPALISIDKSGQEDETYDSRTLDGDAGLTLEPTGFVKPPVISVEYFYDAAHTVHAFLKTTMNTPANLPVNTKLTYTDAGPVSEIWACVGIGIDEKFAGNDGVKATAKFTMSGLAS